MTYLNNLKNILSNKKFDYIILLTTIGLLNGHNIYASSEQKPEPNTLKCLFQIYINFLTKNNGYVTPIPEYYVATLLNEERDSIKNAFHQHPNINFRGTSCISRCCRCKSFADSFVLAPDNEKIYLKSLVEGTFYVYKNETFKVLYMPKNNDFIRQVQRILFMAFGGNLSELPSLLKRYYQMNKSKYNGSMANITDETFSDENIRKILFVEANEIPSTIHSTTQKS